MLLVVTDELHQTLEVGRGPQHEVPAVPVDATVLHLALGPGEGRPQGADTLRSWQPWTTAKYNCYIIPTSQKQPSYPSLRDQIINRVQHVRGIR